MTAAVSDVQVAASRQSTANLFYPEGPASLAAALHHSNDTTKAWRKAIKIRQEYKAIETDQLKLAKRVAVEKQTAKSQKLLTAAPTPDTEEETTSTALTRRKEAFNASEHQPTTALAQRASRQVPKAEWHPPWKLMRVISGHMGWVRSVSVDVSNEWFATGAGDRVIKIWDLASGELKLSLTGHIAAVRGLVVSPRHPYLFSAGEDKQIKCWDLEYNKVIRQYHGHLSGVYSLALHPTLDVLVSGGRDSVARVWDMRTRQNIHTLVGHKNTVASVLCQETDPQVITGSMDSTIRCWDLAAGKTMATLTHHKKSVRALAQHPTEFSFASASPDNIKQWKLPEAQFLQNLSGHKAIINTMSLNRDNVLFSGGDNGSMRFWDWKSGQCFQRLESQVQPGSLESEAGIFCSTFDRTGTRLITGEADKTIKIWKEDETAVYPFHFLSKGGQGPLKRDGQVDPSKAS